MSTGKFRVRYNNENLWCPVKSNDVFTPRLAVRHNSENLYTPLNTSAVKPRLAFCVNGSTKYISLLPENLVSWLRFDESTTKDECGNTWAATGTVNLDTTIKKFGSASLHCQNNGYIYTNNLFNVNAAKWTFDAWVYSAKSWSDGESVGYFGFCAAKGSGLYRRGILNDNGKWMAANSTSNGWQAGGGNFIGDSAYNQWCHYAVVKNDSSLLQFINGELKRTNTLTQTIGIDNYFLIGSTPYSMYNNCATDVYIDNVRFFNGVALWTEDFTPPMPTPDDYLVSYLKFDESTTKDECGNTWTAISDAATVSADNAIFGKALTAGDRITLDTPIMLGGQDFTVDFWFRAFTNDWQCASMYRNGESSTNGAGGLFGVQQNSGGTLSVWTAAGEGKVTKIPSINSMAHYAFVYQHSAQTMKVYQNGILVVTSTGVTINRTGHTALIGSRYPVAVDEFRIYDGLARWTSDFTPPTAADYS